MTTLMIEDAVNIEDVHELEGMIKELKGEGFNIFRRFLPFGINKVVALNVPSFADAALLIRAMKLKTVENVKDGQLQVIFYDILPNSVKLDDLLYNDGVMTTVGNKRKDVASAYFDIGE